MSRVGNQFPTAFLTTRNPFTRVIRYWALYKPFSYLLTYLHTAVFYAVDRTSIKKRKSLILQSWCLRFTALQRTPTAVT